MSFNIEESEKRRKQEVKLAQQQQNHTLTTVPRVHNSANTPNDVISDLFIDNYHRGMIKTQRETQTFLHRAFNQITEYGHKRSIGGFSEFLGTITDTFLTDLAQEFQRGQQHILSTFSKNDEFAISIVEMFGERAKKQGGEFEFTTSSGWDGYRKWQEPVNTGLITDVCFDKDRCRKDSTALIDKMFSNSYLFDRVKTQIVIAVPDMDSPEVTRSAVSGLWGLIEDLKKSFAVLVGVNASQYLLPGRSSSAALARLWSVDKAVENALQLNVNADTAFNMSVARLENIRDIDKILNNMAWDTMENGSAQWEYSVVNPRLGPARDAVNELNLQIDQVEAEMKSVPDASLVVI